MAFPGTNYTTPDAAGEAFQSNLESISGVTIGSKLNMDGLVLYALANIFDLTAANRYFATLGAAINATALTFTTNAISVTALATPAALTATQFTGFASTVSGAAIMGFGTTNDVALMNRAGTVVLGVGPNTTAVNIAAGLSFVTSLASTTALATPSALAATQFTGFASTVSGAAIMGFGTTNDVALMNRAGTVVIGVGPNTTAVSLAGATTIATGGLIVTLGAITTADPANGVGYAVGAGGTVTQATNKGTTVVLSKPVGTITLNGAALAADTTVSFTWTNTVIGANDVVHLLHDSVGTLGAYTFAVTPAAGSASVAVHNCTPGSLSEAIVLRFAVIKGAVA